MKCIIRRGCPAETRDDSDIVHQAVFAVLDKESHSGGVVDGDSVAMMRQNGVDPVEALAQNDSYHALHACNGLVITGPTGTNVNDVAILLVEG